MMIQQDIYKNAIRIRLIEEAIAARYSEQKMRCPTHLSIGQELVPAIVSSFLTSDDKAYSSHRAHAHYLAKGGSLDALIAELYGKETGCTAGRGGSMHLTDLASGFVASTAIVGNSIPLAVGNALHQKLQSPEFLTAAYFGDGATEEGAFYESANFAVLKSLPVLFVCENNKYSVYSPLEVRQPEGRKIFELAEAIGLKSFHADGNDFEQSYKITEQAIAHIRSGQGPAFLEFDTYRHREHCGPNFDDDLGYRPQAELDEWLNNDPIVNLESQLAATAGWTELKSTIHNDITSEIASAFEKAENANFAPLSSNMDYIHAK